MTSGARAAVLYATAILIALALVSACSPTAPVVHRLVVAHALLGGLAALFAWALLASSDGPGSFRNRH